MPVCPQLVPWGSPKTSLAREGVQTHRQHQPGGAKGQWSPMCRLALGLSPPLHPCPASHPQPPSPGAMPTAGDSEGMGPSR